MSTRDVVTIDRAGADRTRATAGEGAGRRPGPAARPRAAEGGRGERLDRRADCQAYGVSGRTVGRNRQRVVDWDVPVEIDSVRFSPGDLVIADEDGVVIVPREIERQTIRAAWLKVHAADVIRDTIRAGLPATDAFRKYGVL